MTVITKHKSANAGLCHIILFVFLIVFSGLLSGCDGGEKIQDVVTGEDSEDDDSGYDNENTEGVVILTESDIADFDKFYKPAEFADMNMLRSDSKWSFVRSRQSDHFFVFWEEGFGDDPNAASVPEALRVDIDDLLEKAEEFYDINVNTLGFATIGHGVSNLDKYKMEIYLLYQAEWLATGSGYDDVIGALWVNPGTCKPVGSTIAHEIGHSFQYQTYSDLLNYNGITNDFNRGFRYGYGGNGGNAFWEQCAQWQSFQSYPDEAFTSYNFDEYMTNYHRHFCHEMQRYASYWLQYYWTEKHGIDYIGKIWRASMGPEDPIETYMRLNSLTVEEMNAELYDAASKMVTWDLDAIRSIGANYIGKYSYKFYQNEDGYYQVAYSKCPGSTGYNVIPLNVPKAGTVVSTSFVALTPGSALAAKDPGQYNVGENVLTTTIYNNTSQTRAGYRYGYVALLNDGTRVYGEMNSKVSDDIEFTIPENCENLWLVVLGAPTTYKSHPWDDDESNDDQWPYKVRFTNTDLLGNITIDENATPENMTLTYDVSFDVSDAYTGTTVNLYSNGDISKIAQAFVMQPSAISGIVLDANSTPQEGKIAFAAVESSGSLKYETSANGYGFWYAGNGDVISWGENNDSKIFTELTLSNFEFSIGQYPGKSVSGDQYTVKQALVYTKNGSQYQVTFVFNITLN
ncbi:DUF4859 domain-containing protein [Plebeiibacterium sediminum]|uniref:DUF4859 domain-containing protein n=1 Tax=Plebeiibacterium sediminum TaxID=2992112 RepID=A0AAE3SEK5_9BACT|nr:DUF4859 domain-containing protein [Plebeiobacterium sediminum]MCW3786316.1 DUF4859 domain-containing protein [Plebeiobacterium sediminum]